MNGWIIFWTIVYVVSCSLGALMVLLIIPFGFRDLVRLYHLLNADRPTDQTSSDQSQSSARE